MAESIYDEYPSMTLAKEQNDQNIEPLKLGQRIKDIRSKLGITLEEASQRTGLARSTLSKIENEQISPTFQAMQNWRLDCRLTCRNYLNLQEKKWQQGVEISLRKVKENHTQLRPMSMNCSRHNFPIRK